MIEICSKRRTIERRRWPLTRTGNIALAGLAAVAMAVTALLFR